MPKCKICTPMGEKAEDPEDMAQTFNCGKNSFPGYDFCPQHLSEWGIDLLLLMAEHIADKET